MASKRTHFATRKYLLRGPDQVRALVALIPNLPVDPDRPLEIIVREEAKERKLSKNALYWAILTEISEQAWLHGKQYSKDVWHEYAKKEIMPNMIKTKDGEERTKWCDSPTGSPVAISTTMLEDECFGNYITALEAFGAGLGVRFSTPRPRESPRFSHGEV